MAQYTSESVNYYDADSNCCGSNIDDNNNPIGLLQQYSCPQNMFINSITYTNNESNIFNGMNSLYFTCGNIINNNETPIYPSYGQSNYGESSNTINCPNGFIQLDIVSGNWVQYINNYYCNKPGTTTNNNSTNGMQGGGNMYSISCNNGGVFNGLGIAAKQGTENSPGHFPIGILNPNSCTSYSCNNGGDKYNKCECPYNYQNNVQQIQCDINGANTCMDPICTDPNANQCSCANSQNCNTDCIECNTGYTNCPNLTPMCQRCTIGYINPCDGCNACDTNYSHPTYGSQKTLCTSNCLSNFTKGSDGKCYKQCPLGYLPKKSGSYNPDDSLSEYDCIEYTSI